ncbi:Receptor-type tyrosine-protein phosphatase delta-like 2 [Homarus americanus]|uniref:Receptor-type tyrosine-protein phosphatase delta-like 2 n=1 Tax=Homarus americanus TaxID=6706 RepID=A0A8J5JBQ9_HOMAM|nr:Receptor-type tyrosine-protein phosphatase delta-like 2 [Homarus americanus]
MLQVLAVLSSFSGVLGAAAIKQPSAPPGHVTCESDVISLVVTWSPPPPRHRNGVITNYRLAYSHASHGECLRMVTALLRLPTYSNTSSLTVPGAGEGEGTVSGPRAAVVSWALPARPHGRISCHTVHWEPAVGVAPPTAAVWSLT